VDQRPRWGWLMKKQRLKFACYCPFKHLSCFLFHSFFFKTMLCVLFKAKCVQKSESITHIWVTGSSEECSVPILTCNVGSLRFETGVVGTRDTEYVIKYL
jgi:hypothetical protein